jgi:hypothetical protein
MLGSIIRDLLVLYVDLAKFVVSERLQPNPQSFFLNLSSLPKESKHQTTSFWAEASRELDL